MSDKCKDGVELPLFGCCPVCGADRSEQCKGRAFIEIEMRREAERHDEQRNRELEFFRRQLEQDRDQRLP